MFGRIKHHLKHTIWNTKNTILFVGYQAPGTLGRRIVDGEKRVKILGEEFQVKARVEYIEGYSGHADQNGLLAFACSFREKMPKHIFLVHGEIDSQLALREKLNEQLENNVDVEIPDYGQEFELDDTENVTIKQKYVSPIKNEVDKIDLINKIQGLESELSEMKHSLKEEIRIQNASDENMMKLNQKVMDLRKQIVDMMKNDGSNNNEDINEKR